MRIILPEELNTYDVLVSDWLVFTQATLDTTVARLAADAEGRADADGTPVAVDRPGRERDTDDRADADDGR